jgi:hypothetical protein
MNEQEYEQIMDRWAEDAIASAPELRPTAEMYRLVQSRQKGKRGLFFFPRWAVAGTAAAGLLLLLVSTVLVFPTILTVFKPGLGEPLVAQREGAIPKQDIIVLNQGDPPHRGPKGPVSLKQLMFQLKRHDSQRAEAVDLILPFEDTITLTSDDNYRLLLEPAKDGYIYAFQLTSSGTLVKLFPQEAYSSIDNPLQEEQVYYLPAEPNWLYLDQAAGEERLSIIASTQPLTELEDLYTRYVREKDKAEKQAILSALLTQLENLVEASAETAAGWTFVFRHE